MAIIPLNFPYNSADTPADFESYHVWQNENGSVEVSVDVHDIQAEAKVDYLYSGSFTATKYDDVALSVLSIKDAVVNFDVGHFYRVTIDSNFYDLLVETQDRLGVDWYFNREPFTVETPFEIFVDASGKYLYFYLDVSLAGYHTYQLDRIRDKTITNPQIVAWK